MKTLLWREVGFNRQILIAGAAFLLLPYLFTFVLFLWPNSGIETTRDMIDGLVVAAICSYTISQLTVILLAGNAFAGERADRSAEFMTYLPISRTRRLISKLILTAVVTAIIWGFNLLILWGIMDLFSWRIGVDHVPFETKYTALTGLLMFGICWLISSSQSSPSFSVVGGLATPILLVFGLVIGIETYETQIKVDINEEPLMATWYTATSITLGILGFVVGTWYFLRRVEP